MAPLVDRPGAFQLSDIYLLSYTSADSAGKLTRLNIRELVQDINIYEDIEGDFLSGDIQLSDSGNIIQSFPLTGFERIEFYFRSPGTTKGFDFSVATGHPMFVYALENRQEVNPRFQVYSLKFCSLETLKNNQVRVSSAFATSIDEMVMRVCKEQLETKKDVFIEETSGTHKFVIPRLQPIDTIDFLAGNAVSKNFDNSGFLFYETAYGFNFKSYESLFCLKDGSPREVKAHYSPKVKNVMTTGTEGKEIYDLQSVEEYRVLSQYDTLGNLMEGVYSSRLISVDAFSKTFSENDFDYTKDYGKHAHLEMDPNGGIRDDNGILPIFNYSKGKRFSEFPDGVLFYQTDTSKVHDTHELPNNTQITQKRESQDRALNSLVIQITVPGTTTINVGDIVHFSMPKHAPDTPTDVKDTDKYLTGRYLIVTVRHHISSINKRHTMVMKLVKDSFNISYPEEDMDLFTNNEDDKGEIYAQYQIDESI